MSFIIEIMDDRENMLEKDSLAAKPALARLLQNQAAEHPDDMAYSELSDDLSVGRTITYGALHDRAMSIARELARVANAGDRALLLFPPGIEFVAALFACFYSNIIGVPAPIPKSRQKDARYASILFDAQPRVELSCDGVTEIHQHGANQIYSGAALANHSNHRVQHPCKGHSVAYLQYTSGSTGDPKGVMITHDNVLNNLEHIADGYGTGSVFRFLTWLPHFHDMGLVGGLLQPLYAHGPCYIMRPMQFLKAPQHWLRAISAYRITHTGGPDFAFRHCIRRVKPTDIQGCDLSSWSMAYVGAESVRATTVERFVQKFHPVGFRREALHPCYGLAEATLKVTGEIKPSGPVLEPRRDSLTGGSIVGSGQVSDLVPVLIVDHSTGEPCPNGTVGEIWIGGPCVAAGYWGRDCETAFTFQAYTPDGRGPYLRSGDLGYVQHGELFVTGRLKEMLIFRGKNHYPEDIESSTEEAHDLLHGLRNAALQVEADDEPRLLILQEVGFGLNESALSSIFANIRRSLAENHDLLPLGIVLLRRGSIPTTSSGKIQRVRCAQLLKENHLSGIISQWWQKNPGEFCVEGS